MLCWGIKLVKPKIALKCTNSAFAFCSIFPCMFARVSKSLYPCPIFRVKPKEMRGDSSLSQSCISYLDLLLDLLNRLLVGKRTTLRKSWHKLQILTGYLCLCRPRGSLPSDLATTFKPQNRHTSTTSQWGDNPKNILVVLNLSAS